MFLIAGILSGFLIMHWFTGLRSKIRRKMPNIKIKRFDLCPYFRVSIKGRIIHFHHWFNFTLLLVISAVFAPGFLADLFPKGFLIGGIIQGLIAFKARSLIYRAQESYKYQPK
ncbi:MAG: hypothetical protein U1C56_00550 [Candidatus Curtissbacteria bacterium]|nr:hypothetical protein [Candidatus Curtissbacteria bacterium]